MTTVENINSRNTNVTQACPQCRADIPVHRGYVAWCSNCEWNLQPEEEESTRNPFEAQLGTISKKIGKRLSQSLFSELSSREALAPRLTFPRIAAFILAGLIHGVTAMVAICGVWLIVAGFPNLWTFLVGGTLLGVAWLVRPTFGRLEEEDRILGREQFPQTFTITDSIAKAVGTQAADRIVVDHDFNAGVSRVGLNQKKVLSLGLPLLSIMDKKEATALLAHEFAHEVNGDPNRGVFVGSAVSSLYRWSILIQIIPYLWHKLPLPYRDLWPVFLVLGGCSLAFYISAKVVPEIPNIMPYTYLAIVFYIIMAKCAHLLMKLLARLSYRDMQRAEYLADSIGARVAGTSAMLGVLEKLHFSGTYRFAVQNAALYDSKVDFFQQMQQRITRMPASELERIRRIEKREESRIDRTHPPTFYRIELLKKNLVANPSLEISDEQYAAMVSELRTMEPIVEADLMNFYRNFIYA